MPQTEKPKIVTIKFCDAQFQFRVTELTADDLKGFIHTDPEIAQLLKMMTGVDDEKEWYLDDDGFRLPDEQLFEKSMWSLIDGNRNTKVVMRMMNSNGEGWFRLTPWVRIGDEFNQRPQE